MIENLVIGSGPSGVAASYQLLKQGQSVTILDGGIRIEERVENKVSSLASKDFAFWDQNSESTYKSLVTSDARFKSHIGSKLKFGSNFCYTSAKDLSTDFSKVKSSINAYPSLAVGGLSHVWGSICFPLAIQDKELLRYQLASKHYQIVDEIMTQSGISTEFLNVYDLHSSLQPLIQHSNLSESLKNKYVKSNWFGKNRFEGGRPRIAVFTQGQKKCQSCGLCATGCVWDSIWNSMNVFEKFHQDSKFNYLGIGPAIKIEEKEGHFVVSCKNGTQIEARRLFLACGALSTTILLSRSNLIRTEVNLDDTQLTLVPCISLFGKQTQKNFVLSQFILHSRNTVGQTKEFIQITGYNPDLVRRVQTLIPLSRMVPRRTLDFALKFVATAMIFQDSESSGKIRIETIKDITEMAADSTGLVPILKSRRRFRLYSALLRLNLVPLPFLSQQVGIGESYHFGNLKNVDGSRVTDEKGNLIGVKNLFIVDSSSLDLIAPGPITYSTMANAVRIVQEAHS